MPDREQIGFVEDTGEGARFLASSEQFLNSRVSLAFQSDFHPSRPIVAVVRYLTVATPASAKSVKMW
jgi:hypothetical protein